MQTSDPATVASNLRRTRADMLGTADEEHYWHCHEAATLIERLSGLLERALICGRLTGHALADEIRAAIDAGERP